MSDSENQAENADSSGIVYIYRHFSAIFTKISFKDHIKSWPHFYVFF